jgi:hypothetical protein
LLKQANQSSLGDQFGTILTIMASGLKINNKTRLEILKYEYILNLVQVMNRKGDDKSNRNVLKPNIFRDNKLKSILS